MANVRTVRRRLLREAVEENYATMFGAPAPSVQRRLRFQRFRRGGAWGAALALAFTGTWVLAETGVFKREQIITERVALIVPPPPQRPVPRIGAAASLDSVVTTPMDRSVFPYAVRRIVIDAGHGGHHVGTSSPGGMQEKEITLDVANRLAALLRAGGFEPLLTRSDDKTLTLEDRGDLANELEGDIFVSIHVNWFSESDVRAVETFYLGPTEDRELQRLAARENEDPGIPLGEYRQALERVFADVRRQESRQLARTVQQELHKSLQTVNPAVEDRGVKSAPFGVLTRTRMPAILTEVGCLSNDQEVALLANDEYRQFLAEALLEGIRSYALELNPNLTLGS